MAGPQLTTCLWFDGRAEEAARFYTSIFPNSKIVSVSMHLLMRFSADVCSYILDQHRPLPGGRQRVPRP